MRQPLWKLVLAANVAATLAYFATSDVLVRDLLYAGIGLGATVSLVVGARRQDALTARAWRILAAANGCFVGGDLVLDWFDVVGRPVPFPSVAEAVYLSGYPLLLFGVVALSRRSGGRPAREDTIDAVVVTVGLLSLLWPVLISVDARDATISMFGRLVTLAYPVMDIGVIFVLFRSMVLAPGRRTADALIAASLAVMTVSDLGYELLTAQDAYRIGNPVDLGWMASYALLAVVGLRRDTDDGVPLADVGAILRGRLPAVAAAGFLAPVTLLFAAWTKSTLDVPVLVGCCLLVFALITVRLSWLLAELATQRTVLTEQAATLHDALQVQHDLEASLRHQASHDSLTGLPNRVLFHARVERALAAAPHTNSQVAVLFCDLDGFKAVNDSLGHHVGDDLLRMVAERLRAVVREGDTVARLGGDEFAILMSGLGDRDDAYGVADRAVAALRRPLALSGHRLTLSLSVGVSFAVDPKSVDVILSEADAAMYVAKSSGKDCFKEFEDAMHTDSLRRLELRHDFDDALDQGQFFLQYQPNFRMDDQTLEGFEALVRWRHPRYGVVPPDEFIPLAEESGFIVPLGRWILETACLVAAGWDPSVVVAVNVSVRQLEHAAFVDDVAAVLSISGLDPRRVVLEVTEGALLGDPVAAAVVLTRLRERGLRIAIDDFGTGFASLSYLQQLPVDIVKIDRSFIAPLTVADDRSAAFVASIIRLAHDLDLRAVAEGIETAAQHGIVTELGCDSGQGFLLHRPMDTAEAGALAALGHRLSVR